MEDLDHRVNVAVIGAGWAGLAAAVALEYPGKFHMRAPRLPAPLHLAAALLGAHGLTWGERLAALRFMTAMRRIAYRIDADKPVSQYLAEQGQSGALARYLWEPLCVSALNTPAASASAQVFLNVLRDALDGARAHSDLLIPRVDLGRLFPRPAADYVCANGGALRLGAPVRTLDRAAGGFVVDAGPERYSHTILAVGPHQVDALLDRFAALAPMRQSIAALAYEPIYTCYLQYPPQVTMPQAMTGFDSGNIQWIFDRGRLNGIPGLLAAVISARGAHQASSQDVLADAIHRELGAFLPGLPAPLWSRVIAEKRATFSCRPGVARPENRTAVDDLCLAGDYTASDYPATLEAAVRSGLLAADLVIKRKR